MISLNKIVKTNVFKVPDNYFDALTLSITQRIKIEEEPAFSLEKKQSFSTPKGYFNELSFKILDKIEQIEQKNIDLESLERVNIFKVPNVYFNNLEENIEANIWIHSFKKQNIFQVPDNYFQNLELSTGIERFDKVTLLKTPKGYFETLTERILSKISSEKETKVIKVNWFSTKIRWSAAASIVLMIGMWFAVPQLTKDKTELALEKVSNEDIKTYLETQDLSYLEYESVVENTKIPAKSVITNDLDELKINKQEILEHLENQYLEEEI